MNAEMQDGTPKPKSRLERQREALARANIEVGCVCVSGRQLRYARSPGEGEPILLCNGIGANFELVLPFVRAMENRPIILFDAPGTGGSPEAWFWPSFSEYAHLAVGVLNQLGYHGTFIAAGISWGGGLAQQIARDFPDRVSRLILMATCAGVLMIPGRPSALVKMVTPRRYLSRRFMARNADVIYGGKMRGRPDLAAEYAGLLKAPGVFSYAQQLLALAQFRSGFWLHRIRCKTLIISGDDDPLMPTYNAILLSCLIPNAQLHFIRGAGHLFVAQNADEAARVVRTFLAPE